MRQFVVVCDFKLFLYDFLAERPTHSPVSNVVSQVIDMRSVNWFCSQSHSLFSAIVCRSVINMWHFVATFFLGPMLVIVIYCEFKVLVVKLVLLFEYVSCYANIMGLVALALFIKFCFVNFI